MFDIIYQKIDKKEALILKPFDIYIDWRFSKDFAIARVFKTDTEFFIAVAVYQNQKNKLIVYDLIDNVKYIYDLNNEEFDSFVIDFDYYENEEQAKKIKPIFTKILEEVI